MATKSDRPGLLSKMALFVRNPTKDWSELERPQADQDSGFDKQVLKAMIERKRQNDFIRKREFDQLRKLRSRGVSAFAGLGRPSVFQSSINTDQDGRAVTLKKIDEIEAQMSKQWWKGKQDAAAQTPGFPVAKPVPSPQSVEQVAQLPAHAKPQEAQTFEQTASSDFLLNTTSAAPVSDSTDFESTEMGTGMVPAMSENRSPPRAPPGVATSLGALAQSYDGADVGFSPSKLFAIDVEDMATDPELEEAAIRFANGDDEGAETGLLEALRGPAIAPDVANSWVAALLDLYRATHQRGRFDNALLEFPECFATMTPHWQAIGVAKPATPEPEPDPVPVATAVEEAVSADARDYSEGAIWSSPPVLTPEAMEDLRDAMASNHTPWHLDWSRLTTIEADAMPLLSGLFSSLCNEPVSLRFSGASRLIETLGIMMPSGDRTVSQDWWAMRLNTLRTLNMLDDFELVALDFCVTYEVSPPAWQEARCQYVSLEDEARALVAAELAAAAAAAAAVAPVPTRDTTPSRLGAGSGFSQMATVTMSLEMALATQLELQGEVLGDATEALAGFAAANGRHDIIVSCRNLVRVDFSAAGSILNWVAMREAEGCHVQFRDVHRLVAAFFNVIGINEHARVVPRPV